MARSIFRRSENTRLPAPMWRCPASEFPTVPAGSPTASPDAARTEKGREASRPSMTGVDAFAIRLPAFSGLWPQPSRMITASLRTGAFGLLASRDFPSMRAGAAIPNNSRIVGATSVSSPSLRSARGSPAPTRMKGTGLEVCPVSTTPSG
ncbi:MAG: hypothetical protein A4E67_01697 [Syntrophaceae bacterium PtaB.Bin038]|nr:MAG: hypothetical protein A4E67_01697 [Syntrophaceae bacterium PtaB.Bin038]